MFMTTTENQKDRLKTQFSAYHPTWLRLICIAFSVAVEFTVLNDLRGLLKTLVGCTIHSQNLFLLSTCNTSPVGQFLHNPFSLPVSPNSKYFVKRVSIFLTYSGVESVYQYKRTGERYWINRLVDRCLAKWLTPVELPTSQLAHWVISFTGFSLAQPLL